MPYQDNKNNCSHTLQREPVLFRLNANMIKYDSIRKLKVYDPKRICFTPSALAKGVLTVGMAGSGKTTSVLMKAGKQLMDNMGPADKMIILDVKGEYTEQLAAKDTIIIGHDSYKDIWNIYSDIIAFGKSNIDIRAGEVAEYLFMDQASLHDPFWVNAAKIFLKKILTYHIRQASETRSTDKLNNAALSDFISSLTVEKLISMIDTYSDFAECRILLGDPENGTIEKQGASVLSELIVMRNRIFNGAFKEKGDFSMIDFIRNGSGTLILQMDMSTFNFFKGIFTYLIDISISAIASPATKTGNIFYLLDEFAMLPKLKNLTTAVALLRSKKCCMICGVQSIDQIYSTYDSGDVKTADVVLDIFQNIIVMKSSEKTAEFIKRHFGERETRAYYTKSDGSIGERSERRPIVELNDVIYLNPGEAYLKFAQSTPFKVKFSL